MKITLIGSRWFGAETLKFVQQEGITTLRVVVPAADDRLAEAARGAGIDVHVLADPRRVPAEAIAGGTDLIVSAHSHAFVGSDALARAPMGGIGFHPSLLPRHRGIAAVEWTIRAGDAIAGGTVYHLAEHMDGGAIAAQEWCFVKPGENSRDLWQRALAPLGLQLLRQVLHEAVRTGSIPARPQDEAFATSAPRLPG